MKEISWNHILFGISNFSESPRFFVFAIWEKLEVPIQIFNLNFPEIQNLQYLIIEYVTKFRDFLLEPQENFRQKNYIYNYYTP